MSLKLMKLKKIISNIKKYRKPYLIEFSTYRYYEHCGPNKDDHLEYRDLKEISYWQKKCPISFIEKNYFHHDYLSSSSYKKNVNEIEFEIDEAFQYAENSKFPKKNLINKYIYA